MTVEEFIEEMEFHIKHHKHAFVQNMNFRNKSNLSFCDWVDIFINWMEWKNPDCKAFHDDEEK